MAGGSRTGLTGTLSTTRKDLFHQPKLVAKAMERLRARFPDQPLDPQTKRPSFPLKQVRAEVEAMDMEQTE